MNAKHLYCSEVVLSCKSLLWQQLIFAIKNRGILPLKVLSSVETPYFHNSVDKKLCLTQHILMKPSECRHREHMANKTMSFRKEML